MTLPPVIGLLGAAGAGKDTTAGLLASRFRAARIAFADHLRAEIAHAWCIDQSLLEEPATKHVPAPGLALHHCTDREFQRFAWELGGNVARQLRDGLTPRTVMQRWGDYRRAQDPDYFVIRALEIVRTVTDGEQLDAVILTDVRFVNEAALVRGLGGQLWRIVRPGVDAANSHWSEHELTDLHVDAEIINDGSIEQLGKISSDLLLYAMGRAGA